MPVTEAKQVNQEALASFGAGHRSHQKNAVNKSNESVHGQVSLPTGTGKTRVQVHLHLEDMVKKTALGQSGVYVVAAHRLVLCRQLLMNLVDLVAEAGLPFDVLFVGSDRLDEDEIYEKHMAEDVSKKTTFVTCTTRQAEIKNAVDQAKMMGRHVLVVSTYHSLDRLRVLDAIDIVTYDEAHTIASSRQSDDNFEAHVKELQELGIIRRQYFFTATRKVSGEEWGMNNKAIYGDLLLEVAPREMILAGEIVPPRIHRIITKDDGEFKNQTMIVKAIQGAFSFHRNAVKTSSPLSGELGAKLLVSADGTPAVQRLIDNDGFKRWCIQNKIRLFVFSSLIGTYMIGPDYVFQKASRNKVTSEMQALPDDQDAILLHIDILTEGIDLPSITGVMTFRELNIIKLLQTIGRASRLLGTDRKRLYGGQVKPLEFDKMVKPYAWVIFPKLSDDGSEASLKMEDTIKKVVEAYDVPKMVFDREDEYVGAPDPTLAPMTQRDETTRNDAVTELRNIVEDLLIKGGDHVSVEDLDRCLRRGSDKGLLL